MQKRAFIGGFDITGIPTIEFHHFKAQKNHFGRNGLKANFINNVRL